MGVGVTKDRFLDTRLPPTTAGVLVVIGTVLGVTDERVALPVVVVGVCFLLVMATLFVPLCLGVWKNKGFASVDGALISTIDRSLSLVFFVFVFLLLWLLEDSIPCVRKKSCLVSQASKAPPAL